MWNRITNIRRLGIELNPIWTLDRGACSPVVFLKMIREYVIECVAMTIDKYQTECLYNNIVYREKKDSNIILGITMLRQKLDVNMKIIQKLKESQPPVEIGRIQTSCCDDLYIHFVNSNPSW